MIPEKTTQRVVIITGASRGIGQALARAYQDAGWSVAGCSSRTADLAHCDLGAICDVADAGQVRGFVSNVAARFGRIDALINNAGVAGENSLDSAASDDFWHQVIGVNLNGTYFMSKAALPHLGSGGRIINIASVLGLKGVPDQTAYCAAKHGVVGFTRALSHAVAARGITVNAICPGWTRTAMAEGRMRELGLVEKDLAASMPIGRMIEPAEVASLALYLCGAGASGITGQALTLDGGSLA